MTMQSVCFHAYVILLARILANGVRRLFPPLYILPTTYAIVIFKPQASGYILANKDANLMSFDII